MGGILNGVVRKPSLGRINDKNKPAMYAMIGENQDRKAEAKALRQ